MAKTYFGIDVSEHNGTIDWAKIAKNVDFAILRIGWVGNSNNHTLDKKFVENYNAAKKHGVKIGAYVYMYSKTTEAAENGARWVLNQIQGKSFDMPIYCDMEDASISNLSKSTLTSITDAFNKTVASGGFRVGVYANLHWFTNKLDASLRKAYHTWIAHYTTGTEKYRGSYDMWQNSSKGKVDGVNGRVDTNYLYEDIFASSTSPATQPSTKPVASSTPSYQVGKVYVLSADLNVRTGAGTKYRQKLRSELTYDGKKHAKIGVYAVLKKGTSVTVQKVVKEGNNIWLQIPSGFIAAYHNGNKYVK